jgi:hypothetical protein
MTLQENKKVLGATPVSGIFVPRKISLGLGWN